MGVLWIGGAKRYRGELMRTTAVFSLPTPPPPKKKEIDCNLRVRSTLGGVEEFVRM